MSTLPLPPTAVASTSSILIVASGSTLHFVNSSGTESSVTANGDSQSQVSGLVRNVALSQDGKLAVTAGDDKSLHVWDVAETLTLRSTRHTAKKVADLSFGPDGSIIVTDKVGDVYLYPLEPRHVEERPQGFTLNSDPSLNPDATYMLGHVSVVSQHVLSPDGKRLITADRDEHIRVSRFPNAYVIDKYLFGSDGFVSAIHIPLSRPDILVSAGGEPTLQIWDWSSGELLSRLDVWPAILPHRRVRPQARKVKSKRKIAGVDYSIEPSDDPASDGWYRAPEGSMFPAGQGVCVEQIGSVRSGDATVVVFFSEGCAALHAFALPVDAAEASTAQVQTLALPFPVLGFAQVPGSSTQLITILDASHGIAKDAASIDAARVDQSIVVVEVGEDGILSNVSHAHSKLVAMLTASLSNTTLAAEPAALAALNLYPNLSLLPRWPGFEEDEELAGPPSGDGAEQSSGKQFEGLNLRQLGRLKAHGVDVQELLPKKKKRKRTKGAGKVASSESAAAADQTERDGAAGEA